MNQRLIKAWNLNTLFLLNILKELEEEDVMLRFGNSNTLGWILGHIIYYRGLILKYIGEDFEFKEYEKSYMRGAEKDITLRLNLDEAKKEFMSRGKRISKKIAVMTPADFDKIMDITLADGSNTIGGALSWLNWHEAFHFGQIDLIKVASGKNGIK